MSTVSTALRMLAVYAKINISWIRESVVHVSNYPVVLSATQADAPLVRQDISYRLEDAQNAAKSLTHVFNVTRILAVNAKLDCTLMAMDSVQSVLITYRGVLNVMPMHAVNVTKNIIYKIQYASFAVETFPTVLFVKIRTLAHNAQVRRFSYRTINAHHVAFSTLNARPAKEETTVSRA